MKRQKRGYGQFKDVRVIWVVQNMAHCWERQDLEQDKLLYTMPRIWALSNWKQGVK